MNSLSPKGCSQNSSYFGLVLVLIIQLTFLYSSDLMKKRQETSHLMFGELFGTPKYFNQRPWDVAMTSRLRKEYEDFENIFMQDVHNDKRDLEDYIYLMKMTLNGPVIYHD